MRGVWPGALPVLGGKVLVVVRMGVEAVGTEVEVVRVDGRSVVDGASVVDLQITKVLFTVPFGPQISE